MRWLLLGLLPLLLSIPASAGLPGEIPRVSSLSPGVMWSCPVTDPNQRHSPLADVPGLRDYPPGPGRHGNGFLWVRPGGGKWLFLPGEETFWNMIWVRAFPGRLEITARRLDAPAPPMEVMVNPFDQDVTLGAVESWGWFPSEGCWEIIGHLSGPYGQASLRIVILVIRLPFQPLKARWLPSGLAFADTEIDGALEAIRSIYRPVQEERERLWWSPRGPQASDGLWIDTPFFSWKYGVLILETARRAWRGGPPNPSGPVQRLIIQGKPARCIQSLQEDAAALIWEEGDLRYRVLQWGLELGCVDLRQVVEGKGP
ncbi:hypothetical protein HRbin22_01074 [Candidatus Thermoflexus japonica]|uniref:Uncharacterized protein n=1 Tax=Candidatus Thermoflexus japonica TaxID=2035417 RepID=A0A2H5Y608_9CHLR|nr:hypothetical protein HRbin22_01074 [Candidatus Thermoflexus japonica]